MESTPNTSPKTHAARQQELLEQLDQFYKDVESHDGPFPNAAYVMALERELFEELAHVTYDMHRESRTV